MSTRFSVTSLTSPLSNSQHPLFAEPGLFRQESNRSSWTDGGKESIVQFLYEWHREWRSFLWHHRLVDECPTDWAHAENVNASITNRLVRDRQRAEEISAARAQVVLEQASEENLGGDPNSMPMIQKSLPSRSAVGASRREVNQTIRAGGVRAAGASAPAVIVGEGDDPTYARIVQDRHHCMITGLTDSISNFDLERLSQEFRFSIAFNSAYARQRAMMLLLRSSTLERIRTVLSWPLDTEHFPSLRKPMPKYKEPALEERIRDADTVARLIGDLMQVLRDAPANAEDDIVSWRRCHWLISTLSLMPGLEGRIQKCEEDHTWRLLPDTGDDESAATSDYAIDLPRVLEVLKRDEELRSFKEEFPDRFFPVVFIDQPRA